MIEITDPSRVKFIVADLGRAFIYYPVPGTLRVGGDVVEFDASPPRNSNSSPPPKQRVVIDRRAITAVVSE